MYDKSLFLDSGIGKHLQKVCMTMLHCSDLVALSDSVVGCSVAAVLCSYKSTRQLREI